jgi:hypothetical protein
MAIGNDLLVQPTVRSRPHHQLIACPSAPESPAFAVNSAAVWFVPGLLLSHVRAPTAICRHSVAA